MGIFLNRSIGIVVYTTTAIVLLGQASNLLFALGAGMMAVGITWAALKLVENEDEG